MTNVYILLYKPLPLEALFPDLSIVTVTVSTTLYLEANLNDSNRMRLLSTNNKISWKY